MKHWNDQLTSRLLALELLLSRNRVKIKLLERPKKHLILWLQNTGKKWQKKWETSQGTWPKGRWNCPPGKGGRSVGRGSRTCTMRGVWRGSRRDCKENLWGTLNHRIVRTWIPKRKLVRILKRKTQKLVHMLKEIVSSSTGAKPCP